MRRDDVVKLCAGSDEDIIWARKGNRELVSYRRNIVFAAEKGLVTDIRAAASGGPKLRSSDKLANYFDVIDKIAGGEGRVEGFVSERMTLESGTDALCIESLGGIRKWIDKNLLDNFGYKRKYWLDESGRYGSMVFIEEEAGITGIVMVLNVKETK